MLLAGRILTIFSILMMFGAYSNFAPTSLGSEAIADYVKNHFVREMIFGVTLAIVVIRLIWSASHPGQWKAIAILGSAVVLPFWVAAAFGWSTGGLEEVWGGKISASSAYLLHGPQVFIFYSGLVLMWVALNRSV
jgi:hypothetical protein